MLQIIKLSNYHLNYRLSFIPPLARRVDNAIHCQDKSHIRWIVQHVLSTVIRWIAIYPPFEELGLGRHFACIELKWIAVYYYVMYDFD